MTPTGRCGSFSPSISNHSPPTCDRKPTGYGGLDRRGAKATLPLSETFRQSLLIKPTANCQLSVFQIRAFSLLSRGKAETFLRPVVAGIGFALRDLSAFDFQKLDLSGVARPQTHLVGKLDMSYRGTNWP